MKYLNSIYIHQTLDFLHRYGLKSVLSKVPEYLMTTRGYQSWRKDHTPSEEELAAQRELSVRMTSRPLFSILVPTYNTDPLQLKQMAESVFSQTYDHWELCIADGSPKPSSVEQFFQKYAEEQAQGKIRFAAIRNQGIAGNTNAAMALAKGDYIVLLDHDDLLSPDALYELAAAVNESPDVDVLYSDEDMVSADGTFLHNPNFKPDFSPDLLRSCNYITHLYAVKRSLALLAGGFSAECDGSQDYDFTLKTTERAKSICHIPKVLYHWRVHSNSVAADSSNKTYAYDSAVRALEQHYERLGIEACVTKDPQPGFYLTDYAITGKPLVSVLMYGCAGCVREEILDAWKKDTSYPESKTTTGEQISTALDKRNGSYDIEFPASLSQTSGDYVLVLRHVQEITMDTVRLLLSNCMRQEVGIAVPRILAENGKVVESGLIFNQAGRILSPFAGKDAIYPGYHCFATCQRQISLAGPYCFMSSMENLRRNWREEKKGNQKIAESTPIVRMAGFCFRTQADQKLISLIPRACVTLTAKESRNAVAAYKAARPGKLPSVSSWFKEHPADPYYTPNFSQDHPYRF